MQPEPYAFIGLVKPDLALTREKQHGNHPTGFISDAKATTVVEARQRQYGPRLDDTGSGPGAVRAPTNSGFIYANREWCDEQDGNNDGVCTLPHPDESLHERRELQHFGGFLRCACCVDYSCASSSSKHGDDVERGSSNVEFDMRSQERRTFLRKAPVGAVLGSTPSHGDTNNVHNLCSVCEVVSGRILAHLAALERRSKLEKLLHPQRELCSLKHHDNPSALKVSSDSCHLCALIWSSLNDKQQSRLIAEDESLFDSYREGSTNIKSEVQGRRAIRVVVLNDMLIPHFGGFKRPRRWEKSVLGFRDANTEVGSEFANPLYLTGPDYYSDYTGYRDLEERRSGPLLLPVADTTGSDCVIDWIAHTFKARRNKTSWLPTRVLDVRSSLTGRVLLRLSKDLPESERTQYTALSHCWGKVRLPILTQNNIEQRLVEGLDVEELPRTFVEAMEVTLKLGISYIWIDSFCIIQDSGSDWDHEAALMASVYRNAFCTIAAVDATDGNGGLFRPQYPLKSSPCLI
ncbi:HET-domain-containing protein, partial [Lophiostoma macrostomum CBS 122681]